MNAIIEQRFGPCVHCGGGPDNHRDDAGHPYEAAQDFQHEPGEFMLSEEIEDLRRDLGGEGGTE